MDKSFLTDFKDGDFFLLCPVFVAFIAIMRAGPIWAYIGFDCTALSLHVGSLLPIMCFGMLPEPGLPPIVLLGGGTPRIGVPSG
jgi:Tyrosyl-tRNA synthetase